MPDWWEGFKVGQLVEDNPLESFPKSRALVIRLCPSHENPHAELRPIIEIQWVATGAKSLMFTSDLRRVKQ
jgi:hypothetical protein